MAWDRFYGAGCGIAPKSMCTSLAFKKASVLAKVLEQSAALHSTVTVS